MLGLQVCTTMPDYPLSLKGHVTTSLTSSSISIWSREFKSLACNRHLKLLNENKKMYSNKLISKTLCVFWKLVFIHSKPVISFWLIYYNIMFNIYVNSNVSSIVMSKLDLIVYMRMCIFPLHPSCACVLRCTCTFAHTYEGQRSASDIFPQEPSTWFVETGSLIDLPQLAEYARFAGQQAPGITCFCLPGNGIIRVYHHSCFLKL